MEHPRGFSLLQPSPVFTGFNLSQHQKTRLQYPSFCMSTITFFFFLLFALVASIPCNQELLQQYIDTKDMANFKSHIQYCHITNRSMIGNVIESALNEGFAEAVVLAVNRLPNEFLRFALEKSAKNRDSRSFRLICNSFNGNPDFQRTLNDVFNIILKSQSLNIDLLEVFIEFGVNFNAPGSLIIVAEYPELVLTLLEYGFDSELKLHYATSLLNAIQYRRFGLARQLITAGADMFASFQCYKQSDYSILGAAIYSAHSRDNDANQDFIFDMIKIGAPLYDEMLCDAAKAGLNRVVSYLLAEGFDINRRNTDNNRGWAPLHYAVHWIHRDTVQLLLDSGAEIDITDETGRTPLILACKYKNLEIIRMLVERGADVNKRDSQGFSPYLNAIACGADKIISYLKSLPGLNVTFESELLAKILKEAFEYNNVAGFDALIELNAPVLGLYNNNRNLLHFAWKSHKLVPKLVALGLYINAKDSDGMTPLMQYFNICRLLPTAIAFIKSGADLNLQANNGWTAMFYAIRRSNLDAVKLLVQDRTRIDLNLRSIDGQTAAEYAISINLPEFADLINGSEDLTPVYDSSDSSSSSSDSSSDSD